MSELPYTLTAQEQTIVILREEQNRIIVSFPLFVGEVALLRRILSLFQKWKWKDCRSNSSELQEVLKDPEYLAAIDMEKRLAALERAARTGQEKE